MKLIWRLCMVFVAVLATSCSDNEVPGGNGGSGGDDTSTSTFAKGADVSWLTKLESEGVEFYDRNGQKTECMSLLKDECGVNSIRLRVWVNPADGWNSADDVLQKARRANSLGLDVMVDFHYSDTWADPGQQRVPDAWHNYDITQLCNAMSRHTTDVLTKLKSAGVTPKWVQVGNETRDGMMHPLGRASTNPHNFVRLVNTGYHAVKSVFADAQVIVHLDKGDDFLAYKWLFDILKNGNAQYDMIGMSIYPEPSSWKTSAKNCLKNISSLYLEYGKPVMVCEVGMHYSEGDKCNEFISFLMKNADSNLRGIFYWEPEAPEGYNGGYDKGCFVNGTPTNALNAFIN